MNFIHSWQKIPAKCPMPCSDGKKKKKKKKKKKSREGLEFLHVNTQVYCKLNKNKSSNLMRNIQQVVNLNVFCF